MADAAQALIRPRVGSNELRKRRRRWRARWSSLEREESRHGGERWPESAPARRAAGLGLLELHCVLRTSEER